MQTSLSNCGYVALRELLSIFSLQVSDSTLRNLVGTTERGLSIFRIRDFLVSPSAARPVLTII
jgi:Peptidase C39 family